MYYNLYTNMYMYKIYIVCSKVVYVKIIQYNMINTRNCLYNKILLFVKLKKKRIRKKREKITFILIRLLIFSLLMNIKDIEWNIFYPTDKLVLNF